MHFRFQDNCAKRVIVVDFNGGTVDGRKPDDPLLPEIFQAGIGLSPSVPVPHAVDFRRKIIPYTCGSIAGKDEQHFAFEEINWTILFAHSEVTSDRHLLLTRRTREISPRRNR